MRIYFYDKYNKIVHHLDGVTIVDADNLSEFMEVMVPVFVSETTYGGLSEEKNLPSISECKFVKKRFKYYPDALFYREWV